MRKLYTSGRISEMKSSVGCERKLESESVALFSDSIKEKRRVLISCASSTEGILNFRLSVWPSLR